MNDAEVKIKVKTATGVIEYTVPDSGSNGSIESRLWDRFEKIGTRGIMRDGVYYPPHRIEMIKFEIVRKEAK